MTCGRASAVHKRPIDPMATEVTDHIKAGFRNLYFFYLLADILDYFLEFVRDNVVLEWSVFVGIFMKYESHLVLVLCRPG